MASSASDPGQAQVVARRNKCHQVVAVCFFMSCGLYADTPSLRFSSLKPVRHRSQHCWWFPQLESIQLLCNCMPNQQCQTNMGSKWGVLCCQYWFYRSSVHLLLVDGQSWIGERSLHEDPQEALQGVQEILQATNHRKCEWVLCAPSRRRTWGAVDLESHPFGPSFVWIASGTCPSLHHCLSQRWTSMCQWSNFGWFRGYAFQWVRDVCTKPVLDDHPREGTDNCWSH